MILGKKIRAARQGKYTQAELAEILGVHEMTLRRWELGQRSPDADMLPKIAKALNISISDLIEENKNADTATKNTATPTTRSSEWMLVYEKDGERIELPPTPEGYSIFKDIVASIANRNIATKA